MNNEQTDGNKEMIAFGLMNIVGSIRSHSLKWSIYITVPYFMADGAINYARMTL